ncbi:hypothetical protein LCGC14_1250760 [marine sediment metagenome]|uniref:Uncharacterized protein n=1 Tax=marine sediment metagenome TaxID=412755 RepID=A0A0F9LPW0_9ZZZZ
MRSLHADLLSKIGGNIDPAIRLVFTSQDGGTTYDYSFDPTVTTNRSESLTLRLEPFDEYCQIQLRNDDLAVPSLVGYYIDLGLGANTDSGLRYGEFPRLWVKQQHTLSGGSKNGKKDLKVLLELEGVWAVLRELFVLIGTAPFYNDNFGNFTGKTIYGILEALLETFLYNMTGSIYDFTLDALGDQDDSIINSLVLEPVKDPERPLINQDAPGHSNETSLANYDTFVDVIAMLLGYTGSYLRADAGLSFKIIYPQSTDSVNETYYSSQSDGHVFYENTDREFLKIPNRVKVFGDTSEDQDWSSFVEGEAFSDDWTDSVYTGEYMHNLEIHRFGRGISQAAADALATFKLNKSLAETFAGRTVIPFDPRVELYDRVRILDTR